MELISSLLIPAALALLLSVLLTPATIRLAGITGSIDLPDGNRKLHSLPTARLGGLGFFTAFLISVLLSSKNLYGYHAALLTGGAVIVAGGVLDDTHNLNPILKLVLQLAAALVGVASLGIPSEFSFLGLFKIPLAAPVGLIIAVIRILLSINAVNFCDGLDGLATGLSSIALVSIACLATSAGRNNVALASLILVFSLLGFLPYNRHPARIYMGDCGSQFLGYAIAILSLASRGDGNFAVETMFFLSIPLIDTWFSAIRRIIKGKSPFSADKGHLHHILLKRGFSHTGAVKILVCTSGIIAATTLLLIL